MKRKKIRLVFVFLLIIIIGGALWWSFGTSTPELSSEIYTSGFIEATDVAVASEVGGRIVDITAGEGERVAAGVPLVKLDDSVLKAEQKQAEAAIKAAQATLEQTISTRDQVIASRTQSIVTRDGTKKVWENALEVQRNPLELDARIAEAQNQVDYAEVALQYSLDTGLYSTVPKGSWVRALARQQLDSAQTILQSLLNIKDNPQEINTAVDQAQIAYQKAVAAAEVAEKAVEVAEKAVQVAETRIEQAEASLELLGVKLSKLILNSPITGVVAEQYAEIGEIAQPGVPILKITELAEVTLTAYVPESKIGLVKLGQEAIVSVDSYPGESFSGKIVYISPRALFTPRNIQLKEEREKMVFAVEIKLKNLEQKLKPGMPADARIITGYED